MSFAAIDGGRRSTNVTTLEAVELLLIRRSDFLRLIDEHPRIAVVVLRMVARRLRYADAQQAQLATHDVVGCLAQRLVELCERFGRTRERGIEIDLPMSQEEIGSWVGASREGVSRGLHVLRGLRIIETGRRRIHGARRRGARAARALSVARLTRERARLHRAS